MTESGQPKSEIKIGTWNLDGRWDERHRALIVNARCDIWLLTEVHPKLCDAGRRMAEYHCHFSDAVMPRQQHWAAIMSLEQLDPLPDPHIASAAACVGGVTYCSSILPWAGCGNDPSAPWRGISLEERARTAITEIVKALPTSTTVWGGDWNQNLAGAWQHVGSSGMRREIESAIKTLGLKLAVHKLPHRLSGSNTIDHIAVPTHWVVRGRERIQAPALSDHDAYVIKAVDMS